MGILCCQLGVVESGKSHLAFFIVAIHEQKETKCFEAIDDKARMQKKKKRLGWGWKLGLWQGWRLRVYRFVLTLFEDEVRLLD
ncbi:hypothetical protein RJT34_17304 [Clitoria ternatea]|uniref:Uncharacterized protein n=1 Tax=Clitoria ternatea TaxID=43366 RepID=A0AAN9J8R2_CLITE